MKRSAVQVAGLAFLAMPQFLLACEGCKSSAEENGSPNAIGEAFGYSIYFMLTFLALVVGSMIVMMVRAARRIDQERAALSLPQASG